MMRRFLVKSVVGWLLLPCFCLGIVVAGCTLANRGRHAEAELVAKPPPPAPAVEMVPLDPTLHQEAIAELNRELESNDPLLRSHAVEGMRDSLGGQASAQIIKALSDPDPLVRFSACLASGSLRLKDAYPQLVKLASDPDPSVQIGAKFALHRLGDTSRSHDLEKTAKDPQASIRGETAMVLGMLGEPSAVKVLKPMLFDPVATVRLQAAGALWQLGSRNGLDALVAGSISKYSDDQMVAILALAQPRDRRVLGHVEGALTNPDQMVCLVAARATGMLGSDRGYGVALKGAASADPRHRTLAAFAIGAIGRTDAQPQLALLLKDSNADVRIAAATAVLQLKPG